MNLRSLFRARKIFGSRPVDHKKLNAAVSAASSAVAAAHAELVARTADLDQAVAARKSYCSVKPYPAASDDILYLENMLNVKGPNPAFDRGWRAGIREALYRLTGDKKYLVKEE